MPTIALPHRKPFRQLAPFILLAVVLHAAVLIGVKISPAPLAASSPLIIRFEPSSTTATTTTTTTIPATQTTKSASRTTPKHSSSVLITVPENGTTATVLPQTGALPGLNTSYDLVRDEAVKIERAEAEREKQRLSTPLAQLQQAMRQPHSETRLANGLLKITTDSGESLCYQPVPNFARDMPGLYGIPTTCP